MSDTRCYVLGLKSYQNNEIECIEKIMTKGYSKYAIFPDVPIFVNFKTTGFNDIARNKSHDQLAVVGYVTLHEDAFCDFSGEEHIVNIDNNEYGSWFVPGWFGDIRRENNTKHDRILYNSIEIDYRTSNQRYMQASFAVALGRVISFNLLRDVTTKVGETEGSDDVGKISGEDGWGAALSTKTLLCARLIEAYVSSLILMSSGLGKFVDITVRANDERSRMAVDTLSGAIRFTPDKIFKTPFDIISNVMLHTVHKDAYNNRDKIDIATRVETVDDLRIKLMNDTIGLSNKRSSNIKALEEAGKLDEYVELYNKYFEEFRKCMVERVKKVDEGINKLFSHIETHEQISEDEVNELYESILLCADLLDYKKRPAELDEILKKLVGIKMSLNKDKLDEVVEALKNNTGLGKSSLCNTALNNLKN